MNKKKIVVFAGNHCSPQKEKNYYEMAYKLGKTIAEKGFVTVTGGGPGLMDQVSKGAFESGGKTIGICLDIPKRPNTVYLTEKRIYQGLLKRQETLIREGDAYIALPGGIGTLSEVTTVLTLKRKKEISANTPIILIKPFYHGFIEFIKYLENEGFITPDFDKYYTIVSNPKEAVDYIGSILNKYYE